MHGCVIFEGYEIIIQVDFSIQIMKAMNNYGRGMYSMHRAENKGLLVFLCVCSTYSGGSIRVKGGPIMRIVEKMLYGIGGLLALVLLFILFCHFKPELAKNLGETIQANAKETEELITEEKKEEDTFDIATASDGLAVLPIAKENYAVPTEDMLELPSWAKQKSGMTPIKDQGTQITEEEVAEIPAQIGMGKNGKGLSFDALMYPYYHMLDATGQAIYRQIYANANAMIKDFAPVEAVSPTLLKNAFISVVNDHPELFWVNTTYQYKYAPSGRVAAIYLSFNKTADNIDMAKGLFEAAADEILSGAQELDKVHDKELFIHDALVEQISYNKAASMNQSAYSALVLGKTVCAGYARAYQYLLQQLGIPCYYCTGYAGENHAWNIVKLEDTYYNVDVTWSDTKPQNYLYFNGTDADYAKDHIRRDLAVNLPVCNGTLYRLCEIEYEEPEKPKNNSSSKEDTDTSKEEAQQIVVLRTLEQVGFEYEDLIRTIQDYYADCSQQLVKTNSKNVTFKNVVKDDKLWKEIMKSYEKGDYENAYMNRLLAEKHLGGAKLKVTGEMLVDGSYLITHEVTLQ